MADSAGGVDEAVMGLSCVGEYGSAVGVEGGGNETDDGDCGADVTGRTCTAGTRMSAAASCAISYAGSGSWRRGGVRKNSWGRECTPEPTTVIRTGAGPSYKPTAASAGLGGVPWVLVGRLALAASRRGCPILEAVYTDNGSRSRVAVWSEPHDPLALLLPSLVEEAHCWSEVPYSVARCARESETRLGRFLGRTHARATLDGKAWAGRAARERSCFACVLLLPWLRSTARPPARLAKREAPRGGWCEFSLTTGIDARSRRVDMCRVPRTAGLAGTLVSEVHRGG